MVNVAPSQPADLLPLNAMRHPARGQSNGWFIWRGEDPPEDDDFFVPAHVEHLADRVPELAPYLALPAGWRVLLAPGHEDVRYDAALVSDAEVCSLCGSSLDAHDRHVRFTLPDPVLALPEQEQTSGTWMSHASASKSVMMQVPGVGAFVRALLPVKLAGGHTLTFGVWLGVRPADLQSIFAVWTKPEYVDLQVHGRLANAIPPWGLLATPIDAIVRSIDETPYCDHSSDEQLNRVLHDEWPHELVLSAHEAL